MKYQVRTKQINSYTYHVEADSPRAAYLKIKNATIDEKRAWVVDGKSEDENVIETDLVRDEPKDGTDPEV